MERKSTPHEQTVTPRRLDNGWSYRVPQSIQSTPEGLVYQWRGLPPAIAVP
jgi:hypothetical protein